jgi:hypothetical protein
MPDNLTGGHKLGRLICGAKTRTGRPCKRRTVRGNRRCPNHGGLSTGPKTAEGKATAALNLIKANAATQARIQARNLKEQANGS